MLSSAPLGGKLGLVSVVICSYSLEKYSNLEEAVGSLLDQTYKPIEIVVVVDANQELGDKLSVDYAREDNVRVIVTEQSLGLTQARNVGIKAAQGDVVTFFDDDALADKEWIACLVETYNQTGAVAVGGKILPIWLSGKPDYLPEELYWLVGITHRGFAEEKVTEVRDTFGPNMSFRKEVFQRVGYFNRSLGFTKKGTSYIQGEEAAFALRMKGKLGKGVIYNPKAIVYHKVPASKLKLSLLFKRSFYQGYSKALLQKLVSSPESMSAEKSYLKGLVLKYIPDRIKNLFSGGNPLAKMKQLLVLVVAVLAVGIGFILGHVRGNVPVE